MIAFWIFLNSRIHKLFCAYSSTLKNSEMLLTNLVSHLPLQRVQLTTDGLNGSKCEQLESQTVKQPTHKPIWSAFWVHMKVLNWAQKTCRLMLYSNIYRSTTIMMRSGHHKLEKNCRPFLKWDWTLLLLHPSQATCRHLIIFARHQWQCSHCMCSVYCGIAGWRRLACTPSSALSSYPGWHMRHPREAVLLLRQTAIEQMRFCAAVSDAASAQLTSRNLVSCWRSVTNDQLFRKIMNNPHHTLYQLLPSQSTASQQYHLRHRTHDRQLPVHHGHLAD